MKIKGKAYQTIWLKEDNPHIVQIIDQRALPHQFVIEDIDSSHKMGVAIKDMHLRGAPCIGAAAAYGMYLAALEASKDDFANYLKQQSDYLNQTRPTAVDLANTIRIVSNKLENCPSKEAAIDICLNFAVESCAESAEHCRLIGGTWFRNH